MPRSRTTARIDLSCITPCQLAYAAGLFDGEGTVGIYETKNRARNGDPTVGWHYEVQIANTDIRVIAWLLEIVGGSSAKKSRSKEHWRQGYVWRLTGGNAAEFMGAIRPFTIIKSEQIDLAMKWRADHFRATRRQTPEQLAAKRETAELLKRLKRVDHAERI